MKKYLSILLLMGCFITCGAQTIENPVFERCDVPAFHINKVEITSDTTFIYCTYHADALSWANISSETYLMSYPSKKKYKILSCKGLPFDPERRDFPYSLTCDILMCFPSIEGSSHFDIIESPGDEAFNIYGVSLTERNDVSIKDFNVDQIRSLLSNAGFYETANNYEKALEYEKKAMPIIKYWFGKMNEAYESCLFMLGHYYSMLSNYEEAEKYLEESLYISKTLHGESHELYKMKLTTLGSNCINLGDVLKGIKLFEEVIDIQARYSQKKDSQYASTVFLLAQAYLQINDFSKALLYTEEAITIFKETKDYNDEEYIYAQINLAYICTLTNNEKAKELASELLPVIEKNYGKGSDIYLSLIMLLTNSELLSHNIDEALVYAHEYQNIAVRQYGKESLQYGMSLNLMSQIFSSLNNYEEAISNELEYIKIMQNILNDFTFANELGHLAYYYAKIKDYRNALHYTNNSIEIIKRIVNHDFEKYTIDQKYSLWSKFYRNVESRYPLYVANSNDVNEVGNLYNNKLFFKGIVCEKEKKEICTWRDIKESLNEDEIAVEFVETRENDTINCYYALIIKRGFNNPKMIRLFNVLEFGDIFQDSLSFYENNRDLGGYIWGSLKDDLKGVKNIYFSPVGIFNSIGIENLPYDKEIAFSDKYNMFRLSSTRELIHKRIHPPYKKAVLYGGLDYSNNNLTSSNKVADNRSGFDYLYYSNEEIYSVANLLNEAGIESYIFCREQGTESSFRKLTGQSMGILHLATHGMNIESRDVNEMKVNSNFIFLGNNSLDKLTSPTDALSWSFLVLSGGNELISRNSMPQSTEDGIITALEIANMDFSQVDLVVLSACESGLGFEGSDETIYGLQRGFKDAGANTVLMSLRKIDDEATKLLMEEFYKNLMNGCSKTQSLRNAQNYLRTIENGKYNSFGIWGAFVMLDGIN